MSNNSSAGAPSKTGLHLSMGQFDLLEKQVDELQASLDRGNWNDSVQESYFGFIEDVKSDVLRAREIGERINSLFQEVEDINVHELCSIYKNCEREFFSLCRG